MSSLVETEKIVTLGECEHIRRRPDMFIGGVNKIEKEVVILSPEGTITVEKIKYSPALVKIIDEIINNAVDQKIRVESTDDYKSSDEVTAISVTFAENGEVTVCNSGRGIPITMTNGTWAPEAVFTTTRSGSNFVDEKKRYTGGRNGYGAALTNTCSDYLKIKTVYCGKVYRQIYEKGVINKPIIDDTDEQQHTIVIFRPDYEYFENSTPDEVRQLLYTRCCEIAMTFNPGTLAVSFNGKSVSFASSETFMKRLGVDYCWYECGTLTKSITTWKIGIWIGEGQPVQYSFVNGINTYEGGKHVTGILKLIIKAFIPFLPKTITIGKKSTFTVDYVAKKFSVYISTFVPDPSFTGQTKSFMDKTPTYPQMPDIFIKEIMEKTGIIEILKRDAKKKASKQEEGSKRLKYAIDKYEPANLCEKSNDCVLCLVEGDSAGGGIKAARLALGDNGLDYYGVYPLRGKLPNPRRSNEEHLAKNKILAHFRLIMGLDTTKTYKSATELRYSSILICTDQDPDGFHCSGLIINYIGTYWPELLQVPGFIRVLRTPYIKLTMGKNVIPFYSIDHYEQWRRDHPGSGGSIKYYKGLGNSTADEMWDYFQELKTNVITMENNEQVKTTTMLSTVFGLDTSVRKDWMNLESLKELSYDKVKMELCEYVDEYTKIYSLYNLTRHIPRLMDGLKPTQRKIVETLLRIHVPEGGIKVLALTGKIMDMMDYHHGDTSLSSTIVGMAQNYPGTNLVNLLEPIGQFGCRFTGEPAAPRYIFTKLTKVAKVLFSSVESKLLEYNTNEGVNLEPKHYYLPIPLVLLNGASGIGSGWSTRIYKYHPKDVIGYLMERIRGKTAGELEPPAIYYHGYHGKIEPIKDGFLLHGKWELNKNILIITEPPLWLSFENYRYHIQLLEQAGVVKSAETHPLETSKKSSRIYYKIKLSTDYVNKLTNDKGHVDHDEPEDAMTIFYNIQKDFKLTYKCSTKNMWLINESGVHKKYDNVKDILEDFIIVTEKYYGRLYNHKLTVIKDQLALLHSKILFVRGVAKDKKIIIMEKPYDEIATSIESYSGEIIKVDGSYNYLLAMLISTLTVEKENKLMKKYEEVKDQFESLQKITHKHLWVDDIKKFYEALCS